MSNPLADLKELHIAELRRIIETQQKTINDLMELHHQQCRTIEGYVEVVKERGRMIDELQKIAEDAVAMAKH